MQYKNAILFAVSLLLVLSCSTTSSLGPDEQLFTGLKKIDYGKAEGGSHLTMTTDEIEAALATAPNGALFGSSYYRTLFPYGLWIWNAYSQDSSVVAKWLVSSFGKQPVLMHNVNPALRASVAKTILQNNGYFNGNVTYDIIEGKPKRTDNDSVLKPRTAKIQYHTNFGRLFTLDSISYSNYPKENYGKLIKSHSLLKPGDPFSIANLDNERTRIYNLFRNNGYFFYKSSYTSYFADTVKVPGKVQLQMHLADSLPEEAMKKWVIGKTTVQIKRSFNETITDSASYRFLTIKYGSDTLKEKSARKPPIRPRVILADTKLRPGMLFSQDAYEESLNNLSVKGIFSSSDITFSPRLNPDGSYKVVPDTVNALGGESRAGAGILDMTINAVLDKPYDLSFEAKAKGKTSQRLGPGINLSLDKRNAFRGGELLSIEAGANYEFQLNGDADLGNSYDFRLGTSLNFPRLLIPTLSKKRRRWYTTPSTIFDVSWMLTRRAGFFTRKILSTEFSYLFQPSATSVHKFTPLSITYGRTTDATEKYKEKVSQTGVGAASLVDELIPKMRYSYTFNSPISYRNPVYWNLTLTEAGTVTNLATIALTKKKWNDKEKKLFGTPFSQFVKAETDFKKTWNLGDKNAFVFHVYGAIQSGFGNDDKGPFSETLYISGTNDLRAFTMNSIGPGEVHYTDKNDAYLNHRGDMKLVMNLEYRPRLFGSLYGAIFLDMGNVWYLKHNVRSYFDSKGLGDSAAKDIAINTGAGIRYDLDFFVLRLDLGLGLHVPYKTSRSGFFNIPDFKSAECLNFSIGYPF